VNDRRKDAILFFFGIAGIVFVVAIMPLLKYDFHFEYLIAFCAILGIPLAQFGDRKQNGHRTKKVKEEDGVDEN